MDMDKCVYVSVSSSLDSFDDLLATPRGSTTNQSV